MMIVENWLSYGGCRKRIKKRQLWTEMLLGLISFDGKASFGSSRCQGRESARVACANGGIWRGKLGGFAGAFEGTRTEGKQHSDTASTGGVKSVTGQG